MESSPAWCGLMKKPSRVESSSARSRPRQAGSSISTARFWHKSNLHYGIRIHEDEDDDRPFHDDFGGTAKRTPRAISPSRVWSPARPTTSRWS